jgi:hypothetical protein
VDVPVTPYGDPADVRALNGFPDGTVVSDDTLNGWLSQRAAELNLPFRARGATIPITGPADLVQTLRMANVYGAAAMLASAPSVTIAPDQLQATVDVWLSEFKRLETLLIGVAQGDLMGLGVVLEGVVRPARSAPGLALVGNSSTRGCPPWYDAYPFRRRD